MGKLLGLPPTYCLTLRGEHERQGETIRQFAKYGQKVEFFYGFDGRIVDFHQMPHTVTGEYLGGMSSGDIACCIGHLSMIRHWLKESKSDTAFFVEDDINLENCENWSFNWQDMVDRLPTNWKVIQLALIRSDPINEIRLRPRVTADWCVTAYLIKRDYARWLIDRFWGESEILYLHTPHDHRATPIVENCVYFPAEPDVYSFPIFTEKNSYASTFFQEGKKVKEHNDNSEKAVTAWWKANGPTALIDELTMDPNRPPAIPMIGTAVVKDPKWVRRLIDSVDYPVKEFLIINNNGKDEIDSELDYLSRINHKWIDKIRVLHMPSNIGVPASWNLMIKSYLKAPFWIIVNDDVAFTPGFLNEMHTEAMRDPTAGIIHGYEGDHGVGSWDLFLIRDWTVAEYGLFDENLYPAYNEDADYFMRILKKPLKRVMSLSHDYLHGNGTKRDYHTEGRQTSKADPILKEKLEKVNLTNIDYMTEKWGVGWRYCSPSKDPVWGEKYDLKFVRSKYLGF